MYARSKPSHVGRHKSKHDGLTRLLFDGQRELGLAFIAGETGASISDISTGGSSLCVAAAIPLDDELLLSPMGGISLTCSICFQGAGRHPSR